MLVTGRTCNEEPAKSAARGSKSLLVQEPWLVAAGGEDEKAQWSMPERGSDAHLGARALAGGEDLEEELEHARRLPSLCVRGREERQERVVLLGVEVLRASSAAARQA